ncbi:hypothetical protein V6N11_026946 [Hibiscus sabdariffa]|uniref:RNase H type-1 domain-containing protein n=1 Tax=Hibiscus sabdariffa TaxID=183260 RepID=A0ABR2PFJ0_9ROSI
MVKPLRKPHIATLFAQTYETLETLRISILVGSKGSAVCQHDHSTVSKAQNNTTVMASVTPANCEKYNRILEFSSLKQPSMPASPKLPPTAPSVLNFRKPLLGADQEHGSESSSISNVCAICSLRNRARYTDLFWIPWECNMVADALSKIITPQPYSLLLHESAPTTVQSLLERDAYRSSYR